MACDVRTAFIGGGGGLSFVEIATAAISNCSKIASNLKSQTAPPVAAESPRNLLKICVDIATEIAARCDLNRQRVGFEIASEL